MSKITDVVLSPKMAYTNDFCVVMQELLSADTTLKLSSNYQYRGHRPKRIWLIQSYEMLTLLSVRELEEYYRTKALLLATASPRCEIITVSDWR